MLMEETAAQYIIAQECDKYTVGHLEDRHYSFAFRKGITIYTGCPQKKDLLLWRAVAPINFELGSKVGGVLESSGPQL